MSDRLNSLLELLKKSPDDSFLSYGAGLEYISTGRGKTFVIINKKRSGLCSCLCAACAGL